jgi:hypothetical protein
MYAGLHYRFDLQAGHELGRQVAVKGHSAIPLD